MHAAQSTRLGIGGDVALHDSGVEPVLREFSRAEAARKEAALILVWLEIDYKRTAQRSLGEFHVVTLDRSRDLAAAIPPEEILIDLLRAQKIL